MYRIILSRLPSPLICLTVLITAIGIILLSPACTSASVSPRLSISPAKFNLPVKPGEKQEVKIRITNRSEVPVPLKAVTMDFAPKDAYGGIDYGRSMPNRSAAKWFEITPVDMTLAPDESKEVLVSISPPSTIDPGGFYAVVMFQANLPNNYFDSLDETQAKVIPWIGTLFLLQNGDAPPLDENALTIKRFSIPRFSFKDNVPALVEVSNNTVFHLSPEAEFSLSSLRGPVKARITTEETTILPNSSRIFEAEIVDAPALGLYQGKAIIRIASFQRSAVTWPLVLITLKGAIILALLLLLIILLIFARHRLVAAAKAFVGITRHYKRKIVARRSEAKKLKAARKENKKTEDRPQA